jgi:hypothetical protein
LTYGLGSYGPGSYGPCFHDDDWNDGGGHLHSTSSCILHHSIGDGSIGALTYVWMSDGLSDGWNGV